MKVRSGEHIGISPLTFRKLKPSKESAICDHLVICKNISSFDEFALLLYMLVTVKVICVATLFEIDEVKKINFII